MEHKSKHTLNIHQNNNIEKYQQSVHQKLTSEHALLTGEIKKHTSKHTSNDTSRHKSKH